MRRLLIAALLLTATPAYAQWYWNGQQHLYWDGQRWYQYQPQPDQTRQRIELEERERARVQAQIAAEQRRAYVCANFGCSEQAARAHEQFQASQPVPMYVVPRR
jgi:hypothetical protein